MTLAEKVAEFPADTPDWAVADVLNTPDAAANGTKRVDVASSDIQSLLLIKGAWAKIVMGAEAGSGLPADARGLMITVRDALVNRQVVKATDPEIYASVQQMAGGLVLAGVIDQATADRLMGLAEAPMSWAEANGVTVDARAVGISRGAKP